MFNTHLILQNLYNYSLIKDGMLLMKELILLVYGFKVNGDSLEQFILIHYQVKQRRLKKQERYLLIESINTKEI
jgi:hypothetical protein